MSDSNPTPEPADAGAQRPASGALRGEAGRHLQLMGSGAASAAPLADRKAPTELQSRGEFLAVMSHEIRTPLNAVMGYIELLDTALAGPLTEMQREYLERMRASTDHLTGLVSELLDFGRLEAGKLEVDLHRAYADDAIAAALSVVRPMAGARGITIHEDCADHDQVVYEGDDARFRQVLVKLLGNAIKFTPAGGTVRVGCERRSAERASADADLPSGGEWLCVTVGDSGPGIPEGKLASIFEPFVQAEGGYARPVDGAGLGLTIARRLTRLMGGDITVRSRRNEGAAFTVWMPVPLELRSLRPRSESRARGPVAVVPQGCAEVGDRLGASVDAIVAELVAQLRREPGVSALGLLSDAQLEDHLPALLAGIGQSLVILAETPGDPSLSIRDGTEIQRLVADRHGAQRYRIGWAEAMVHREYDLLRDLVAGAVGEHDGVTPAALRALQEFFDFAERTSIKGHRLAREAMERE